MTTTNLLASRPLSVAEAGTYLGKKPRTIRRLFKIGVLPGSKVPGMRGTYFQPETLKKLMDENERSGS